MSAKDILAQSPKSPQPKIVAVTRRTLLKNLAVLIPFALLPKPSTNVRETEADISATPMLTDDRTATIDKWASRIDETIVILEKWRAYLLDARAKAAHDIDSDEAAKKLWTTFDTANDLCCDIECGGPEYNIDALLVALTGRSISFIAIKNEILAGDQPPDRIQLEIDYYSQDDPDGGVELQAIYDAHFGAGVTS